MGGALIVGASDPGGNRTPDQRIKSPLLYRLSYRVRVAVGVICNRTPSVVRHEGLEPSTNGLRVRCSTNLS